MAEHDECRNGTAKPMRTSAVVETKIVSPKGARVTETVFVLSTGASRRLEIMAEIPALRNTG